MSPTNGSVIAWTPLHVSLVLLLAAACDQRPATTVAMDNGYAAATADSPILYRARWHAVSFDDPVLPGASSTSMDTVPASSNIAYVVLARGWDPTSAAPPTSLVVMQSRDGFAAAQGDALHIPVNDATFMGDCAAGSVLSQAQADFITQHIFPNDFGSVSYNAATCSSTSIGDASAE